MTAPVKRGTRPHWMTPFGSEGWGDIFSDRLWPEWHRDFGEKLRPAVDFYEEGDQYHLTMELAGLNRDDINISMRDNVLTVSGCKEKSSEKEGKNYYLKESTQGSFSRSFRLPTEVEEDKIEASFKDGVLTVRLPRTADSGPKKIQIH